MKRLCLNWCVEIGRTASRDVRGKLCLGEEGNGPVGLLSDRRISEYGNKHHQRILAIYALSYALEIIKKSLAEIVITHTFRNCSYRKPNLHMSVRTDKFFDKCRVFTYLVACLYYSRSNIILTQMLIAALVNHILKVNTGKLQRNLYHGHWIICVNVTKWQ